MHTTRPPSYVGPFESFSRTPSYSAEPRLHEQRLALNPNPRFNPQPTGNFLKSSKDGEIKLRLTAQEDNLDLPVYGSGGVVEGSVELDHLHNISSVEIKVEGHLHLKENAEGGHIHYNLCLDKSLLWIRRSSNPVCPSSLHFSRTLPSVFQYEGRRYPLPPSHSIKHKGLPGFQATIEYSVSVMIHVGNTTVSTPFIYYPRTRPAVPIPPPLLLDEGRFIEQPEWTMRPFTVKGKRNAGDINVKFYLPASRSFFASQAIPFHITFESTASSLAAFRPYGPTTDGSGKLRATRLRIMRKTAVNARRAKTEDTKAGIWRDDYIGEAVFKRASDGPAWMSFSGEIEVVPIKVMGFSIPGLFVQDCILLTVAPPEGTKAPAFVGIREVIPIRLTTDAWIDDGRGITLTRRLVSVSPSRWDAR
ncbi:hypothetical protein B0H19DRAFT_1101148 [Mycena capillaripes]|nr:hypothetical protein B0H19DRAFT_1101148 [Mycena capillaripes]